MATFTLSFNTSSADQTQNVTEGDTILATVSETAGGSIIAVSPSNCSVSPTSYSGGSGTFTITNFSTPNYSITFQDDDREVNLSGTVAAGAGPVAPTISSVTQNNAAASTVTATVNLSDTGSNGTLQYIQKSSSSTPAATDSAWQTSNTFSHSRNTTQYYWAQRIDGSNRAISNMVSLSVPYLSTDSTISVSPSAQTLSSTATQHTITISSGSAETVYQVRDSVTTHESRTGNGDITVTDVPAAGASKSYTIFAQRPLSSGGSGVYVSTNTSYIVTLSTSGGGGGGGTGSNTTSEQRLVLGKVFKNSSTKYGLFISKDGVDVIDGSGNLTTETNLIFDSTTFKAGVVYKTYTPTVNESIGTWTTSSLGYIPAMIASGVFFEPYYFNGANADLAKEEYQALPVYEITQTTISKKTRYGGGTSWTSVMTPNDTAAFLRFPCQYGKMTDSSIFGFTGTTPPTSPSAGVNRVCLGNHPTYGYGLFISRPGINVLTASREELIFDTDQENYSQILTTASITLTRATLANPSQYDQTITFQNTGEVPAVTVVPQDSLIGIDAAQIEIVSLSTTSVVLRLPYKANIAGTGSVINPASATARVIVIKKG